jgi:hypothetical protein
MLAGDESVKLRAKSFDPKKISPWRNNLEVRYGRTDQLIAPDNNNDSHSLSLAGKNSSLVVPWT